MPASLMNFPFDLGCCDIQLHLVFFVFLTGVYDPSRLIWAASWQNQQNGMRRLRSAWAFTLSDQSSLSAWRKLGSLASSAQTGRIQLANLSLRWGHTRFVGFVMRWLISLIFCGVNPEEKPHGRLHMAPCKQKVIVICPTSGVRNPGASAVRDPVVGSRHLRPLCHWCRPADMPRYRSGKALNNKLACMTRLSQRYHCPTEIISTIFQSATV